MNLAETIAANQKAGFPDKNRQLVGAKLKELVSDYKAEVIEVLHKCGISVSTVLPDKVILAIVIKHLSKNALLRETISKMLLELNGYYNAIGISAIGGALSAVGTILAGIGRGQTQNTDTQLQYQQQQMMQQQQQQLEQDRRRRNTWIGIGISAVVLLGAILLIRSLSKSGQSQVQTKMQPQLIPAGV